MEQQRKGNGRPDGPSPLELAGIGFDLVVPVLVGLFGGRWLDGHLGSGPWLTLAGAVLGGAAGMLNVVRRVSKPPRGPSGGKR